MKNTLKRITIEPSTIALFKNTFITHNLTMFKNRFSYYILMLIFGIMMFTIKFARAEEDEDDDIIGEIIVDLLVGAAVGVCQSNAACNFMLTIIALIFIVFALINACINGCDDMRYPTSREMRRASTMYVGSRLTN